MFGLFQRDEVRQERSWPHEGVVLPNRRPDLPEWIPPKARPASRSVHVNALVKLLQDSGVTGIVEHWRVTRCYQEAAWMNGLEPLTDRQLLMALNGRLEKTRPTIPVEGLGRRRIVCYTIPNPDENIVSFRGKAKRPALRSRERAGSEVKAA